MAPHLAALSGVILDLGPGTGAHLRHIRPEAVTRIYGIEPCVGLHAELARSAELAGLRGKYTIVAAGVEEALRGSVVGDAEVDAVLAVRVLCCVRDLEQTASGLWRVLRPGGRLVFFEHVRAAGAAGWLQHLYNVLWPHMLGCRLDARTDEVLVRGLEWTSVDVWEERDGVMPWVWGKAVK
ncbi:MAG: hypothetical protein M1839_007849 [Geoglossum umbratile]|nr:MAG: hypothetical protein M1839_007849 [Geoglossum umbratile]